MENNCSFSRSRVLRLFVLGRLILYPVNPACNCNTKIRHTVSLSVVLPSISRYQYRKIAFISNVSASACQKFNSFRLSFCANFRKRRKSSDKPVILCYTNINHRSNHDPLPAMRCSAADREKCRYRYEFQVKIV